MTKARVALPVLCLVVLAIVGKYGSSRNNAQTLTGDLKPLFLASGEGRRVGNPPDEQVVVKLGGGESGSTFEVMEAAIGPQGGPPLHVHDDEDEAFYVVRGTFRVRVGESTRELGTGAFVYAPRGLPHAFLNVGTGPGTLLFLTAPPGFEAFWRETAQAAKGIAPGSAEFQKATDPILKKYRKRVVGPPLGGPVQ